MVHFIIRHLSGSRATEVDVIPLGGHRELILGRAPSAAVRFDPRADGLVGRHHARIAWSAAEPPCFEISDLGSRNGTFVNGARILAPTPLIAGDVVRLGADGPELLVSWDVHAGVANA